MKRLFFIALLICSATLGAMATTTLQLVFRTTSGATISFDTKALTMSISNNSITVKNNHVTEVLPLAELSAMYFENAQSGIKTPEQKFNGGEVEVFTMSGISAGKFNSLTEATQQLAPGIYVCGSYKFQVK